MPSRVPDAIAAEAAAELRRRREWDEAPQLYHLYVRSGRPAFVPVPLPAYLWLGSDPADVLAYIADRYGKFTDLLRANAEPGLYGAAFRVEMWTAYAPAGDTAARRRLAAEGAARRIYQRPDRAESRVLVAVDRGRVSYQAVQDRGSDEVDIKIFRPEPGRDLVGNIPDALDKIVATCLGVTLPERSLRDDDARP